jgi:hypothetical protein
VYIKKKDTSWVELILAFILFPVAIIVGGFVLAQLWNWFVPTIFAAAPALTTGQGVGLHTLIGFVKVGLATTIWNRDKNGEPLPEAAKLFAIIILYGVMLLGGYIVHLVIH